MTLSSRPAHRIVGIIGGMGPEATVDLMRRVILKTPARDDQDHVHLIVENNPKIPSRIAHLIDGTGADPTQELIRIAQNLERAGAQALAMPCNTAHAYAEAIARAVGIPLLDMVARSVEQLATLHPKARVGVLASSAVFKIGLYEKAMRAAGLTSLMPPRQAEVMDLIRAVKRGETGEAAQRLLAELTLDLANRTEVILIACSELSVISGAITVPYVDSLDVLAADIIRFAA
jgi:aspartate racemase